MPEHTEGDDAWDVLLRCWLLAFAILERLVSIVFSMILVFVLTLASSPLAMGLFLVCVVLGGWLLGILLTAP